MYWRMPVFINAHQRQGCIYEIYQYSVKSTEAPGDGYVFQEEFVYMKNREKTGKAFRIKWLLLALVAAALIFVPAASHKVSAAKLVYTVKFNNNSGTSKSKTYTALTRNVTLNTTIRLPAVPKLWDIRISDGPHGRGAAR